MPEITIGGGGYSFQPKTNWEEVPSLKLEGTPPAQQSSKRNEVEPPPANSQPGAASADVQSPAAATKPTTSAEPAATGFESVVRQMQERQAAIRANRANASHYARALHDSHRVIHELMDLGDFHPAFAGTPKSQN